MAAYVMSAPSDLLHRVIEAIIGDRDRDIGRVLTVPLQELSRAQRPEALEHPGERSGVRSGALVGLETKLGEEDLRAEIHERSPRVEHANVSHGVPFESGASEATEAAKSGSSPIDRHSSPGGG